MECGAAVAQFGDLGFQFLDLVAQHVDGLEHDFAILLEVGFLAGNWGGGLHPAHCRKGVSLCGRDVAFEDFGGDFSLVGGDRHALRHILELAHVARPGVVE